MNKYRSPTGEEIRVVSTTGHIAIVGDDWRELPPVYHQAAVQAGCEVDQATVAATKTDVKGAGASTKSIDSLIERTLKTMLERDEDDDFTGAGEPNLNVVSKLVGMKVKREQVTPIFQRLKEEAEQTTGGNEGNDGNNGNNG